MAKSQRVRVTRAFRVRGEDVGEGSIIDLDLPTAQDVRNANKAVFVASDSKLETKPLVKKQRTATPENQQITALQSQVAVLTALVEKMTKGYGQKEKVHA